MKSYKLQSVLYDPVESTVADKYMDEMPELPGCRVRAIRPKTL